MVKRASSPLTASRLPSAAASRSDSSEAMRSTCCASLFLARATCLASERAARPSEEKRSLRPMANPYSMEGTLMADDGPDHRQHPRFAVDAFVRVLQLGESGPEKEY